jgi:uncharacterized membrane protein
MSELQTQDEGWKNRTYLAGLGFGALVGVISAYFFVRASEEEEVEGRKREPVSTGTIISLMLAVFALVRQIAESGKPKK